MFPSGARGIGAGCLLDQVLLEFTVRSNRYAGLFLLSLASAAVVAFLLDRAHEPAWSEHLRTDSVTYGNRAAVFLGGGTWADLGDNEYQPGALWFFAVTGALGGDFTRSLLVINSLLLLCQIGLVRWRAGVGAAWAMLALVAGMGPILLYRFEVAISLMVMGGILFVQTRNQLGRGAFLIGAGAATKLYPLILLPGLMAEAARAGKAKIFIVARGFIFGLGLVLISFVLLGGSFQNIAASVSYHFDKPIGVDSLWGSLLPLLFGLGEGILEMNSRNAIHGFALTPGMVGGGANFFVAMSWIPLYFWVFLEAVERGRGKYAFEPGTLFVLLAVYVGLAKLFAPQYAWWAVSILPLVGPAWFTRGEKIALFMILAGYFVASQTIYPLNYSEFVESFDLGNHLTSWLFWLNGLKNLLWIAAGWIGWRALSRALQMEELRGEA